MAALTFHVNVLEANRGYLPGNWDILWSLSVEELFYLFFPVLCLLLGGRKLLVPVLIGFVLAGPLDRSAAVRGMNPVWQDYSYLGRMDAIAMGCLTALLVSRVRFSPRTLQRLGYVGAAMMTFMLCMSRIAYQWSAVRNGLDMSILRVRACSLQSFGSASAVTRST